MCLISETYKEESISYCFTDAAFTVVYACGVLFVGDLLAAFVFRNQSFEIDGHQSSGR